MWEGPLSALFAAVVTLFCRRCECSRWPSSAAVHKRTSSLSSSHLFFLSSRSPPPPNGFASSSSSSTLTWSAQPTALLPPFIVAVNCFSAEVPSLPLARPSATGVASSVAGFHLAPSRGFEEAQFHFCLRRSRQV